MPASSSVTIWVTTRKGAFSFTSKNRKSWDVAGPHFPGEEVQHIAQDPRDPKRFYAAAGNAWFGPHLYASANRGKTWKLSEQGIGLKEIPDATLKRFWTITPGATDQPGVVYMGADPGVLFRSPDHGANWELIPGLSLHSTRDKWNPGAGGMMVHSIQPLSGGRIIVGISAAGAFRSSDSGKTWEPYNQNVRADFAPVKFPEVGQCVHSLKGHPANPELLFQQNHCGIYRADFSGKEWTDISKGLPTRFGFALAVPAAEKQTLFTIPIDSAEHRYVPGGKLRVARSRDAGRTWKLLNKGLPQQNAYVLVLRQAMTSDDRDPAGIYFGTSTGSLFYSRDAGDSWHVLAEHLPPIYSVSATVN